MNHLKLNNGVEIPQLGFGLWQVPDEETDPAVLRAIKEGYRLIDSATVYGNEAGVGRALKKTEVPREELIITTKVWNSDHGYDETLAAFDKSLELLGTDYVDLYLIHWPTPKHDQFVETYKALEKLYKDGRVRAIGVCNFDIEHLQRLLDECEILPVVNQVERHPYFQQEEMMDFCKKHDIILQAWSPLMTGGAVLEDPLLEELADKYGKTPAQIALRWQVDSGAIVIPKSVTPTRIKENFDIFDFELSEEDMEKIKGIDRNHRKGPAPKEMNVR